MKFEYERIYVPNQPEYWMFFQASFDVQDTQELPRIVAWCEEQFGTEHDPNSVWGYSWGSLGEIAFAFYQEEIATAFKLRWYNPA